MLSDLEVFRVLRRHGVPFVIIGGHAVNFHGFPRVTHDADVVWLRSPQADAKLLAALTELEAQYIGNQIDPQTGIERTYPVTAVFIAVEHLMMLWTKLGFLDLFDYVPGMPFEDVNQLFETSVTHDDLQYVSLEWLRRMKVISGREKDRTDLENLPE